MVKLQKCQLNFLVKRNTYHTPYKGSFTTWSLYIYIICKQSKNVFSELFDILEALVSNDFAYMRQEFVCGGRQLGDNSHLEVLKRKYLSHFLHASWTTWSKQRPSGPKCIRFLTHSVSKPAWHLYTTGQVSYCPHARFCELKMGLLSSKRIFIDF